MASFSLLRKGETGQRLVTLPVSRIILSNNRPRKLIDEAGIAELAQSIANCGLLRPLAVRKIGAKYELLSGERRLLAVKKLGYKRVLCILDIGAGDDAALTAMIENIQRENPDIFEVGECLLKLMNRLRLSREQLARRIGKSPNYIEDKLKILMLEPTVRDAIRHYGLSQRHALAALTLSDTERRMELVRAAGEDGLNESETERLSQRLMRGGVDTDEKSACVQENAKPRQLIVRLVKDYSVFLNTVNIACEQLRSGGIKVEMDKSDREDGLDIVIRITNDKIKPKCKANPNGIGALKTEAIPD